MGFARLDEQGWGELKSVYVRNGWHRCGIARRLVERGLEGVEQGGKVRVVFLEGNEGALEFYRAMGFAE